MNEKVFVCGNNSDGQLGSFFETTKLTTIQQLPLLEKGETVIDIAPGYNSTLFLFTNNKLIQTKGKKLITIEMEKEIASIHAGYSHFAIQTKDGDIYTMGSNSQGQLGRGNFQFLTSPKCVEYFKTNKIQIQQTTLAYQQSYFLSVDNKLYVCGDVSSGKLGKSFSSNVSTPTFLRDNVKRIFGGIDSEGFCLETNDGKFFGSGDSCSGQFGKNFSIHLQQLTEIKFFENRNILQMSLGINHTLALEETKDNKHILWTSGGNTYKGTEQTDNSDFTQIKVFSELLIAQIATGCYHSWIKTQDNQFYSWGYNSYGEMGILNSNNIKVPNKLDYPEFSKYDNLAIICGSYNSFFYKKDQNTLRKDFSKLISGELNVNPDFILHNVPAHKAFIEHRIGIDPESVKSVLLELSKEDYTKLIKWVYTSNFESAKHIEGILEKIGSSAPVMGNYKKDLHKLWKDEDSKDFCLMVQDDDEGEDEDEEEGEFEEIPVHKFVLAARCGLFRELFSTITENTDKVKDFSGKTIESIEIFIGFLYTDQISLTADDDPQLIVEELSDAIEYYQLSDKSKLNYELNKIKAQFNLK
ncbi:btk-binding protein-related [Anaeramoeba flamelloides]|uniref:Btk-binding protein-related n=1 Tax=Anaeramoeba flamelloides TaxID=1746091 RepID=A0AAV7YLI2_9EUKA|nr:btk-binding protein-related [Anaeramoeba flamelloides]|eukprot:Anaeramoba_flamelloidesc42273_g7_i1.p1 GENE.c42273_g7_i1~~c42273_g7_i1.p1  ORF type:complete len:582 (+),score=138.96 c42273_g7_i1:66-1811(+)